MAKIFVFSNTSINTLYFSYENCNNYKQYIHDTYIYTYTDRHIKNDRLKGFKRFEW